MLLDPVESFAADARAVRERLVLDLCDPGARMLDATIRSLRAGSRRFAFVDGLVGLGEGLFDVLRSWGVSERFIATNDTPVAGTFVERKYWDFTVRDAAGRELVLIEFAFARSGERTGNDCTPTRCHQWLGMLYDLSFAGRRPFTGLIVVRGSFRRARPRRPSPGPWRPTVNDRHRYRLERFDRACRSTGLLDAMAYVELSGGAATEPSHALGLAGFLATLHRKLVALPPATWGDSRGLGGWTFPAWRTR